MGLSYLLVWTTFLCLFIIYLNPGSWSLLMSALRIFLSSLWHPYTATDFSILPLFVSFIIFSQTSLSRLPKLPFPHTAAGNHQNQFVDGALILAYAPRTVHFLIAAKSYYGGGLVGFFARVFGAIPVARPQDSVVVGEGRLVLTHASSQARGVRTHFLSSLHAGDTLVCEGVTVRVRRVLDDTQLELDAPAERSTEGEYKILAKIDQSGVFAAVWSHLGAGHCIGIFPEGGSHDRADLLELKAGVTLMALGAMEKHKTTVSIVPIGLNYFHGHRFRGSALVEFGKPYRIPQELVLAYSEPSTKRGACDSLLFTIREQMQSVITTAPDLDTLEALHLARRMYVPASLTLTTRQYLELSQRLLKGFETFADLPSVKLLFSNVLQYKRELEQIGLADKHIEGEGSAAGTTALLLVIKRFVLVLVFLVLALPATVLNAPIGLTVRQVADKHAKQAKKQSSVKIRGTDVIASKKLTTALAMVPVVWTLYTLLIWYWWGARVAAVFVMVMPFLSYVSMRMAEEGVALARSMYAMLKMKWSSAAIERLSAQRTALTEGIRLVVTELGPRLAGTAHKDEFERWRVVKEAHIERQGELTPTVLSRRHIVVQQEALEALIRDDEWEDLRDAWS